MNHERSTGLAMREISEIQEARAWQSLPHVINALAHGNVTIRNNAAAAVDELARIIPVRALAGFESRLRELTGQLYDWNELGLEVVRRQEWPHLVWAIFTMHPNGYVRELATRHVARGDGLTLPYLLLRVNDWVPQVREAAIQAIQTRLNAAHVYDWLPSLGLLDVLQRRFRHDHAWLNDELGRLFRSAQARRALKQAMQSADRGVAVWALRAAMKLPERERAEFIWLGLEHAEPMCRLAAAQSVRNWPESPDRLRMLRQMQQDRLMPVRREALHAMLDAPPESRREWLTSALLDKHRSVREAAQFYLLHDRSGDPGIDLRAFYFDEIQRDADVALASAIAGLGETGKSSDADALVPYVRHPRSKVAAAAVRAVAALDRDERVHWLEDLLSDSRRSVAKQAMRALVERRRAVSPEAVRAIVRAGNNPHSPRFALSVLLRRNPHDAFADAILALNHVNPSVARTAAEFVQRYFQRVFKYEPTNAQKAVIRAALREVGFDLPPVVDRRLRIMLK